MRRIFLPVLLVLLAVALVGCSSCEQKPSKPATPTITEFENGFTSVDALIASYQECIEKKDPELLKRLLLTAEDLGKVREGAAQQLWQAYFMVSKRAFTDKNRDLLGQKLELVDYKLGAQAGQQDSKIHVYRGTIIRFKMPDGKIIPTEIPFLIEVGGTWKILGMKFFKDEVKRRGILDGLGIEGGTPKFRGVDTVHDVNIRIKKMNTPAPAATPAPTGGSQ